MSKVSVIIPCYNQGQFVVEAVESVQKQSYTDWEIIVIDDGSTDHVSQKVLSRLDFPSTLVLHQKNAGVAAARNTAIGKATGTYILPLDADDKIGPDYLKDAVMVFEKDQNVKLVYCKGDYFGALNGPITLPTYSYKSMLGQNLIFCSALFRRSDFIESGGYDKAFLTGWEDWDFWLTFLNPDDKVVRLNDVHFFYRIKANSRNESLTSGRLVHVEQQLYKKHLDKYLAHYPNPLTLIREFIYLQYEQTQFEKYKQEIYSSYSYKIGDAILKPFKWMKRKR